jgi:hypothetical protein
MILAFITGYLAGVATLVLVVGYLAHRARKAAIKRPRN